MQTANSTTSLPAPKAQISRRQAADRWSDCNTTSTNDRKPRRRWDRIFLECESCGSRDIVSFGHKRKFQLLRCTQCSLVFMSLQPPAEELQKLYSRESGYYATIETDLSRIPASANEWLHALLKQVNTPGKQFLDVGCANGQLMSHMNSFGWNVCGVDINSNAVSIARSNGLDARNGTLQESSLPAGSFHAIHLGDVIEHVPSPGGMLARVFELLQSQGIVVIRTPNNQNGYARLTTILSLVAGMAWTQSEAPYHLFEFSAKSLSQLLTRHGFVVVSSTSSGR